MVLRASLLVAHGNIIFTHNKAESGGALKILDRSAVRTNTLVHLLQSTSNLPYSLIHSLPLLLYNYTG